jgi:hypothetical protein
MDMGASQALPDSRQLERFRMVLAEYDIVANGIKTLSRQLAALDEKAAGPALLALRAMEKKLCLDREAIWRLQVSDDRLGELLIALTQCGSEPNPLKSLSSHLEIAKRLLSPLGHAIEAARDRNHDQMRDIPINNNEEDRRRNTEHVAYDIAFGTTQLASTPLRFILDTTSRCNLRCLTCYQSVTQDMIHYDLADAPLAALEPAIRRAKQIFIAGVGEPMLSRSAFDLIALAKSGGAYVETVTNGTTLVRGSRAIHQVDLFMISFDGGTKSSYEAIRRNGNFDKLTEGIRRLPPDDRRRICFNVVVCKQNVFTMGDCVELAISLGIGHVHLQEMTAYLPWHDRMELDDSDRAWLFGQLPEWHQRAKAAGVSLVCNLVRNQGPANLGAIDPEAATCRNLAAVAHVPAATIPKRITLTEAVGRLQAYIRSDTPAIFVTLILSLQRLLDLSPPIRAERSEAATTELDWTALREHVQADKSVLPHCLVAFTHMNVNGDGTTRACCKVQNRLASTAAANFYEIWNTEPYRELRGAHAQQIAPCKACEQCREGERFHFLPHLLEVLDSHGIDISLIRKPQDFPVPESCANHPLVLKLGSNVPKIQTEAAVGVLAANLV